MREFQFDVAEESLAFQALLYASGELDDAEARAFEERLALDQAAREALDQAVQLSMSLRGEAFAPDPSWRQRVRNRLHRPADGWLRRLWARRSYPGHPLIWTAAGALAAAVLVLATQPFSEQPSPASAPVAAQQQPPAPQPTADPITSTTQTSRFGPDLLASNQQVAYYWAKLHNADHLTRVHGEEAKRKLRASERRLSRDDYQWRPGKLPRR